MSATLNEKRQHAAQEKTEMLDKATIKTIAEVTAAEVARQFTAKVAKLESKMTALTAAYDRMEQRNKDADVDRRIAAAENWLKADARPTKTGAASADQTAGNPTPMLGADFDRRRSAIVGRSDFIH